jgi:phosphohistidine phosphatase
VKLYVLRHGPAEDGAHSGLDGDRALTESGRKRVEGVARALVALEENPALVVTSPLVRAVQTAEIIALVASLEGHPCNLEVRREMAPGGAAADLVRAFAAESRRRVMVVGHEPDLSQLVAGLLGSFDRPFDKAMVVGLHLRSGEAAVPALAGQASALAGARPEAHPSRPRLRFVLDPKTRRLDPDARG